jgi:hypothetical protein
MLSLLIKYLFVGMAIVGGLGVALDNRNSRASRRLRVLHGVFVAALFFLCAPSWQTDRIMRAYLDGGTARLRALYYRDIGVLPAPTAFAVTVFGPFAYAALLGTGFLVLARRPSSRRIILPAVTTVILVGPFYAYTGCAEILPGGITGASSFFIVHTLTVGALLLGMILFYRSDASDAFFEQTKSSRVRAGTQQEINDRG